ncbi:sorting nexin-4-like isoform X4 [Dermacentor variabilis]|uniref:sorting nexin-4-like isoform X4 n=1 Tax=Dermacentor variabilis TaxID=34621 RepID=UPI003F5B428D
MHQMVQFRWQKLPTDTLDPEFVERRRASLETFLRRVAGHLELSADRLFGEFLRHEASWRDDHSTGGFLHRADSMLRIFNASLRLRNPDKEFEEVKRYSMELKTNLTNFLKSRARLVDATLDFHTLHQQYGQVLSELSHRDGPGYRGDRLQAAGQFMDRLSQAALPFLEEQEEAADRLKEYLAYADALLAVCKHQEVLQYELERKKSLYASREYQRAEIASSGAPSQGLVSRLLHSSSTPEQKTQALEQQLQSLDAEIRAATHEKQEFSEKALAEIAKFQEQKERDLNQALSIFVSTNIRLCREVQKTNIHCTSLKAIEDQGPCPHAQLKPLRPAESLGHCRWHLNTFYETLQEHRWHCFCSVVCSGQTHKQSQP